MYINSCVFLLLTTSQIKLYALHISKLSAAAGPIIMMCSLSILNFVFLLFLSLSESFSRPLLESSCLSNNSLSDLDAIRL